MKHLAAILKRIWALLILLGALMGGCVPCPASIVTGFFINTDTTPYTGPIQFVPNNNPQQIGTNTGIGASIITNTPDGTLAQTLTTGSYHVRIAKLYSFDISVPNDTNTYAIGDLSTNLPTYAYTNGSQIFKSRISPTDTTSGYLGVKIVGGTNVVLTTNNAGGNATLVINSTGSVGGTNVAYLEVGAGLGIGTNGLKISLTNTAPGVTNLATSTTNGIMSSNQVQALTAAAGITESRAVNFGNAANVFAGLHTGTFTGTHVGDGSGLTSLTAANLNGAVAIVNGGTAAITAKGAATNMGVFPLSHNYATDAVGSAQMNPQLGIGPNGYLYYWNGQGWYGPITIGGGLAIGDATNMVSTTNMHTDERTWWRWQGYTNAARSMNTNWAFALGGPVFWNGDPYGPGSGFWMQATSTNGAGGRVDESEFGGFIGVTGNANGLGFGRGKLLHITPDTGYEWLVDSPVGMTNEEQFGWTGIQALNHYVIGSDIAHKGLGLPLWVPGVSTQLDPRNQWLFYANEETGDVLITNANSHVYITSLHVGTNAFYPVGPIRDNVAQSEIHGSLYHDAADHFITFDDNFSGSTPQRLGICDPPGNGPWIVHGNGWPIIFGQANAADLTGKASSRTYVAQVWIDNSGNLLATNTVTASNFVARATPGFTGDASGVTGLTASAMSNTNTTPSATNNIPDLSGIAYHHFILTNDYCITALANGPGHKRLEFECLGATNHNVLFPTLFRKGGDTNLISSLAGTNSVVVCTNGTWLVLTVGSAASANPNATNSSVSLEVLQ